MTSLTTFAGCQPDRDFYRECHRTAPVEDLRFFLTHARRRLPAAVYAAGAALCEQGDALLYGKTPRTLPGTLKAAIATWRQQARVYMADRPNQPALGSAAWQLMMHFRDGREIHEDHQDEVRTLVARGALDAYALLAWAACHRLRAHAQAVEPEPVAA